MGGYGHFGGAPRLLSFAVVFEWRKPFSIRPAVRQIVSRHRKRIAIATPPQRSRKTPQAVHKKFVDPQVRMIRHRNHLMIAFLNHWEW
jgi:hypothetical protein